MIDIEETFNKHDDEHLKFELIENPKHPRPDICAFMILHDLMPSDRDIICHAEHDQIWLEADIEELAKVATEESIISLLRCGVFYESGTDSLSMFV